MKKRIISLLLVIVMMISTSVTSTAVYFSDITTNIDDETFNAINYMSDNGYMNGTSPGIFNPDLNVTRGMFVFLLYVYSKDNGTYTNPYTDVSSSQYYYNAVGWADANDITSGTTDTTFSPNRVLTREQCVSMLYNFAISNELDFIITDVLDETLCDDYNKVTDYAVEAMNWAINQKIIQVENNHLGARETVTRANAALYIHRYEIYIKKLVFGVDTFSFENTPEDFGYETDEDDNSYKPNQADLDKLNNAIDSYYGAGTTTARNMKNSFKNQYNKSWEGSCYGMSMVTILDKLGYIAFNENYSTSDNLYGVTSPANSETIKSIINSFQLSQYIFNDLTETYPNSAKERTLSQGLEQFVSVVKEGKPVVFSFSYYIGSHAVVAFNWYVAPNGDYVVEVYDNYNSSQFVEMVIESDYSNAYFNNEKIRSIAFNNDYSFFMYHFDYDGNANDNNITYAPVVANYTNNDTVGIVVDGFCDYVVTNSEGEKLIFNDCNVTGDMELYDMHLIVSGPGRVEYKYTVNRSDSFTVDCNDGCCTVDIMG